MKTIKTTSFNATITIGLQKGYSDELYSKDDLIKGIQTYQKALINDKGIFLSASVSECLIVLNNQSEPHLKIEFFNYPKFPLEKDTYVSSINALGKYLMKEFKQNRIVISYPDETIMFEINNEVDYRVKG